MAERQGEGVESQFREITAPWRSLLRGDFGKPAWCCMANTRGKKARIGGSVQSEDGPPFFVLSLKAGGTGLNLTAAILRHPLRSLVESVRGESSNGPGRSASARNANVLVHKFVCRGTVEDKIGRIDRAKGDLSGQLLDAARRRC